MFYNKIKFKFVSLNFLITNKMKRTVILLFAAVALLSSCAKSDKCKCTIKVGDLTLDNQIINRPEDSKCSSLKIEDIEGEIVNVDLSKLASINCVNYSE